MYVGRVFLLCREYKGASFIKVVFTQDTLVPQVDEVAIGTGLKSVATTLIVIHASELI